MENQKMQLTVLTVLSAVFQVAFVCWLLRTRMQRDAEYRLCRSGVSATKTYQITTLSLFSIAVSVCYSVFTFHLACADLSRSYGQDYDEGKGRLYKAWNIVQWAVLIWDFGPGLLLQAFQFSAHSSPGFAFVRAIRREGLFYGFWILLLAVIGVITVAITRVFTLDTLFGLLLTVKNSMFSFIFVIWLGYGLQEVPRQLFYRAWPAMKMNELRGKAVQQVEHLASLQKQLFDLVEPNVSLLYYRVKQGADVHDDELKHLKIMNRQRIRIQTDLMRLQALEKYFQHIFESASPELRHFKPAGWKINTDFINDSIVPAFIEEQPQIERERRQNTQLLTIAKLRNATDKQIHRLSESWLNEYKFLAMRTQREIQELDNVAKAFRRFETIRHIQKRTVAVSSWERAYNCVLRPIVFSAAGLIAAAAAVVLVLSNFLLISPKLMQSSPLIRLLDYSRGKGTIPLTVYFVYYLNMIFLFYGMVNSRIFLQYKVVRNNGTDAKTLFTLFNRVPSMLFCISWNVACLLQIGQETAFFKGIGQLQQIPILGLDLLSYLPVVVFVVFLFWVFRVQKIFKCVIQKENEFNPVKTARNRTAVAGDQIIQDYLEGKPLFDIIDVRQGYKDKFANLMATVVDHRWR